MMGFWVLLAVAFSSFGAHAVTISTAAQCFTALGGAAPAETDRPVLPIHEGQPVSLTKIGNVDVPKGAKVYLLGDGEEAFLYHIVPERGESYVLRLQKATAFLPMSVYRRKMGFLEEVLSDEDGDPLPGDKSFQVATCTPTNDPNVMRLPYVQGTDLETLIERYGVDSPVGKRLIALFEARSNDVVARAPDVVPSAKAHPMQAETRNGIRYRHQHIVTQMTVSGVNTGGLPPAIGAAPVWRNIIVDPVTWHMTLVDPD